MLHAWAEKTVGAHDRIYSFLASLYILDIIFTTAAVCNLVFGLVPASMPYNVIPGATRGNRCR